MSETQIKLGELIRLERERQGISIEDFSTQLKISMSNLECIESGRSDTLPSELYFNLFSKSCCEALGIDYSRTVDAIKSEIEETELTNNDAQSSKSNNKKNKSKKSDDDNGTDSKLLKKLIYLFAGIIVVFAIYLTTVKLFFDSGTPITDSEGGISSENSSDLSSESSKTAKYGNYDWNVPEYSPPGPLKLRLVAREASWATIMADGDTAIFRSLKPGRIYDVEAKHRLRISVGIPRVVDIQLNGKYVDLVNPETKRISRVKINQMNLKSFLVDKQESASTITKTIEQSQTEPERIANPDSTNESDEVVQGE